jgi:GH15 family glucan-1,4-alpha-glucosidase
MHLVRRIRGTVPARISFAPRPQFGSVAVQFVVQEDRLIVVGGTDPIDLLAPGVRWEIREESSGHQTATAIVDPSDGDILLEFRYGAHEGGLMLDEHSEALLRSATEKSWTTWLAGLTLPGIRPQAEVRAALTLRALSHSPTGGILAAATTSLPERLGGIRNWDYRYCWIRDAALTARELVALGSMEEGEALVQWLIDIDATLDGAESMRPLYRLDRTPAGAEAVVDSLPGYAGSRPVRVGNAAQGQLQLDVFGAVCLLIDEISERRGEVNSDEWGLTCRMVDAVGRRWQEPDHGIWEIRDIPRQHTYSKMMCWTAVDKGIAIAQRMGRANPAWLELRSHIERDIESFGWNEDLDAFAAAYDQPEADASVLHGLLEGFPATAEQLMGTVAFVERNLREQSGVYRYRFDDGLPSNEGAMHICAAWLAGTYVRMGSTEDALQLLDSLLASAGSTGLLPEQVDPTTGQGLGNHPQAYSHLGILSVCRLLAEDAKA